ncbi:hypothetical protein BGZ90_003658 [Linnemannia elongata]|nr:hypothetical protein BGZ90_003658 [Linnemannia elongata]
MGLQAPFSIMMEPSIAEDIQAKAMLRLAEVGRGLSFNPEVFIRGSLKATFTHDLKFDLLEIVSYEFTEDIPRPVDDPSSSPVPEVNPEGNKGGTKKVAASSKMAMPVIPESAINEFGISSKTLRLLEVSDMFSKMNELLHYTEQTMRNPAESLASYSQLLRDKHAFLRAKQMASSPSFTAASVMPMSASTSIQGTPQIMTSNPGGPNPSQLHDSASPGAVKCRTSVGISPGDTAL